MPAAHRRRAGGRPGAGRLRRQRGRRAHHDRAQAGRPDGRRCAAAAPRRRVHPAAARRRPGARRPVRAPSTSPRSSGLAVATTTAVAAREERAARLAALRDRLVAGVVDAGARRAAQRPAAGRRGSPAARAGCPATPTCPSPAPRATRCSCCSTPAASSARPARRAAPGWPGPATCCWPSAPTPTGRAARCGSASGTPSTDADVDAVLDVIGPVVERARRAGHRAAAMRVLAAMSGGVDSAVAAALAVDAGHDVTGVHLALSPDRQTLRSGARGCCSVEDAHDARRVADELRHPVLRLGPRRAVHARTSSTTSSPSTPPAARRTRACAATRRSSSPRCSTGPGRSASTPSSPVTTPGWPTASCAARSTRPRTSPTCSACSPPSQLAGAVFPLGGDDQGRGCARSPPSAASPSPPSPTRTTSASSPTATPAASWPAGSGSRPGPVVDAGDRRDGRASTTAPTGSPSASGAGSASPSGTQRPRYVLGIEPVTPHGHDRHRRPRRRRRGASPLRPPGPARRRGCRSRAEVQLRAHGAPVPCRCSAGDDGGLRIALAEQQRGVAPGQSAVLYAPDAVRGDRVLGQGTVLTTA